MTTISDKTSLFQKIKRDKLGFASIIIFIMLTFFLSCLELFANDKPILIRYQDQFYFPIFKTYPETTFGGELDSEADYQNAEVLSLILKEKRNYVLWPIIPYYYDTLDFNLENPSPSKPSSRHYLGTDTYGRDLFSFSLYSLRFTLAFGIILTFFSCLIGFIVGAIQGYFGGFIDLIGQRLLELWGGLPQLFILIILAGIITPSFFSLLTILLFFSWTTLVSPVRAEFLKNRRLGYITAAKVLGVGHFSIIFRHILPNAFVSILTFVPFILTGAMITLTSLDYLGLGLTIGSPSLGEILRQGKENTQAPWIGITGFFIISFVLSLLIFIADSIRNLLNPK